MLHFVHPTTCHTLPGIADKPHFPHTHTFFLTLGYHTQSIYVSGTLYHTLIANHVVSLCVRLTNSASSAGLPIAAAATNSMNDDYMEGGELWDSGWDLFPTLRPISDLEWGVYKDRLQLSRETLFFWSNQDDARFQPRADFWREMARCGGLYSMMRPKPSSTGAELVTCSPPISSSLVSVVTYTAAAAAMCMNDDWVHERRLLCFPPA